MEPVTAIQTVDSLISLIKLCRETWQTFEEFRHGDSSLAELVGDTETFVEFLQGLRRVLVHPRSSHNISLHVVNRALQDAFDTVSRLESRMNRIKSTNITVTRRLKWSQSRAEFQKFQARIRYHNITLHGILTLITSETFLVGCAHEPQLLQLCTSAQEEMEGQGALMIDVPVEDEIKEIVATVEHSENISTMDGLADKCLKPAVQGGQHGPDRPPGAAVHRASCAFDCYCSCHSDDSGESAGLLLKLNVTALGIVARSKRPCSNPKCRRTVLATPKKLVFPSSGFRKALTSLLMIRGWNRKHHLNTYRMVPETSESMRYAKHGDLHNLKACIEDGSATPFDTAPDGWSLLHSAAYQGQLDIVQYLYNLGADTEVAEVGGRKPADFAILRALAVDSTPIHREIMETFAGIDYYISDFGFSPIHIAVLGLYDPEDSERPSLQDLISFFDEANNAPVGNDWSAWGSKETQLSPLYADIVQMFRSSANKLAKSQKPILDIINQKEEKWGWPPFHWAVFTGRLEHMKLLVNKDSVKADPFILSPMDRNVLHLAAESKRPEVLSHILDIWEHNKDHLDINFADRWKEAPLHVAASSSAACVKLLLDKGANPNARQENQQVPLHYSSISLNDHERLNIVSLLSSYPGVLLDACDQDGRTSLFELLDWPTYVRELAKQGADLSLSDNTRNTAVHSDNTRNTAVHYACIYDEVETLQVLLQLSSDPGAAARLNDNGNTPLIETFAHKSISCVRFLLKRPDVNCIAGKDGYAPVHYAARLGDAEILRAVLTHPSFKRGQKTKDGKSAEMVALEACKCSVEVRGLLRKYDSLWDSAINT